jgi:cbb3-type cytochrome c oxidase subunit III
MKQGVGTFLVGTAVLALAASLVSCQARPPRTPPEERGQQAEQAFLAYCAMCHGDHGEGDGPLAEEMVKAGNVRPATLTNQERLNQVGREGIHKVISTGGAHTGRSNLMPAWGEKLDPALVDKIADHVMTLPSLKPGAPSATVKKFLTAPPGAPDEGRKLYVYYCSGCHGPEGKGDGPSAEQLRVQHNVRPRDLTDSAYLQAKTDQELYVTVALGGGHAGKSIYMPAWTYTLQPAQIKSVVAYLRVLSGTKPQ